MDSLTENFTTTIIEDATKPIDAGNFEKAMKDFLAKGGKLITSSGSTLPSKDSKTQ